MIHPSPVNILPMTVQYYREIISLSDDPLTGRLLDRVGTRHAQRQEVLEFASQQQLIGLHGDGRNGHVSKASPALSLMATQ